MREHLFTITCEKCGKKLKLIEDTETGDIIFEGDTRLNNGIWLWGNSQREVQRAVKNGDMDDYIALDIYCGCGNRLDDIDVNDYSKDYEL
jgi:hypothetical protein